MSTYKNEAILGYDVNQVFRVFTETAKRDFPKFSEHNPIGTFTEREVGSYSVKSGKMRVEITDYKRNKIYEITSSQGKNKYKSKYEFISQGDNRTKLLLTENQQTNGALNFINTIIAAIFFKGRVKKRFNYLIKGLIHELEKNKC